MSPLPWLSSPRLSPAILLLDASPVENCTYPSPAAISSTDDAPAFHAPPAWRVSVPLDTVAPITFFHVIAVSARAVETNERRTAMARKAMAFFFKAFSMLPVDGADRLPRRAAKHYSSQQSASAAGALHR